MRTPPPSPCWEIEKDFDKEAVKVLLKVVYGIKGAPVTLEVAKSTILMGEKYQINADVKENLVKIIAFEDMDSAIKIAVWAL